MSSDRGPDADGAKAAAVADQRRYLQELAAEAQRALSDSARWLHQLADSEEHAWSALDFALSLKSLDLLLDGANQAFLGHLELAALIAPDGWAGVARAMEWGSRQRARQRLTYKRSTPGGRDRRKQVLADLQGTTHAGTISEPVNGEYKVVTQLSRRSTEKPRKPAASASPAL